MKRELLHPKCILKPAPLTLDVIEAPGEGVRHVRGDLLRSCRCDGCGKPMEAGDEAVAQSIFTGQSPWYSWESDYVES